MVGIDFTHATVEQREPVSFVRGQVGELLPRLRCGDGVNGCILLSTCNRTELYIHTDGTETDPLALLCDATGVDIAAYRALSVTRTDEMAVRHLMEVASGLVSQIFGDDQIITQVREAAALARERQASDSVLDTLFRYAVTAGKRVKTETRLHNVPASAAETGVRKAEQRLGTLYGKRAVVIGNGEIGRLTATALQRRGAAVTVTLRTYRHGETVIPAGCQTCPYDSRYTALEGADLVFSATTSPHCTITAAGMQALQQPPTLVVDLAMPRDVEQAVAQDGRITVWNLDDLGDLGNASAQERAVAEQIIAEKQTDFMAWLRYRQSLPAIGQVKDAAADRVRHDHAFQELYTGNDLDGLLELAVGKTVDLLLGGLKELVTPERLSACLAHILKGSGRPGTEKLN